MAAKKTTKKPAPVPTTGARLKKWLADPALRSKLPTSVLTPAQRAARATNSSTKTAAALANPALRAKLPDSALPPALLAKRKLNQRLNAPIVPGSSETNRDLAHETDAAVAEKYGPEEAQLKTALGNAQQYQNNVGSWYDNYQAELRDAAGKQKTANQTLQSELSNIFAGANQANANSIAQTGNAASSDAATRGATADAGVTQRGQQAAGIGASLGAAFQALARQQAAAQESNDANGYEAVSPLQRFAATQAAQKNTAGVQSQLAALGGAKGAYATEYKGNRLSDEQKNLIAAQALKLDTTVKLDPKTGVPYSAESAAAKAKSSAHNRASTMTKYNVSQGALDAWAKTPAGRVKRQKVIDDYNKLTHPPKDPKATKVKPTSGPGSLSPSKEDAKLTLARTLAGLASTAPTKDPKTGKPLDIRTNLINGTYPHGKPNDPDLVDLALDIHAHHGKLSAKGVKLAHKLGIHVNGNFTIDPTLAPGTNIATG